MEIIHAKTKEVLRWFEEITKIPRCSKHEDKIAKWLTDWAKEHNFPVKTDKVKNIAIKVPASAGFENSPIVVFQGHMDMVCEKTPDSDHDFSKDPIKLIYEGEWLTADKTTLGADNGIAIAIAMAIALDEDVAHGPLELLFTVDEETGLTGANELVPGFIDGKILINVDSEDEGVFTVGCAGGANTYSTVPFETEAVSADLNQFKIVAGGMKGGHSGIDIQLEKANAIKVMGRALDQIQKNNINLKVADITGGSAHNAIPRDCEAVVYIPAADLDKVKSVLADTQKTLNDEFNNTDPDLALSIKENNETYNKVSTTAGTKKIVDFIFVFPHGVEKMSTEIKDLVETSNNFANISMEDGKVKTLSSQRSSMVSQLEALSNSVEAVARLSGGEANTGDGYPPWPPNMESKLLAKSTALYEKLYNKKPVVEVIHAGLECGIIGDKYPGMDMISIGPDLRNPHSPDEKVHVGAIGLVLDFIVALLKELK
jgi:dipeptidase D